MTFRKSGIVASQSSTMFVIGLPIYLLEQDPLPKENSWSEMTVMDAFEFQ